MANIYSLKTGLASDPTVWSGGVVPTSVDRVLLSALHTVTVDGAYIWGGDSTATVVINGVSTTAGIYVQGTLKASRTVNSQLTCRGDLLIALGGTYDYGTEADPIPAAVKAKILLNSSATPAHNKYGLVTISTVAWAGFRMWGANKTPRTTMSAALSTDTVINVEDATLWEVGDTLVFGLSVAEASVTGHRYRAVTGINGNAVTIGANLGFNSQAGRTVMNLTRNVQIKAVDNLYRSHVSIQVPSAAVANAIEIGPSEVVLNGTTATSFYFGGLNLYWSASTITTATVKKVYRPVVHDIYSVSGSSVTVLPGGGNFLFSLFGNQTYSYTVEEPVASAGSGNTVFSLYAGTSTVIKNPHVVRTNTVLSTGYSQGPVGCVVDGGHLEGLASGVVSGSGISLTFNGTKINGAYRLLSGVTAFGTLRFGNCNLGGDLGFYGPSALVGSTGAYAPVVLSNCVVHPSFTAPRALALLNTVGPNFFQFQNKNNDTTQQEIYRKGGETLRDNAMVNRGRSALAMQSWYAGFPIVHSSTVSVGAGETIRIKGSARFNAAYGTATPPTLTVSGMGITPVVYTAPATADVWSDIDISITNPQAYPGVFMLDYSAVSAANTETAIAWFDGIAMDDFVPWTRHYGFAFAPSNPARSVNPVTQLTETQAAALTGISYASGTLTVSGNRTLREVYDWMQWYECSNRLEPILSSTDGVAFTLAAHLDITGSLTGAGTLALTTGKAYTTTGSTSLIVVGDAGRFVKITAPNLVALTRVQLYNITDGVELSNAVIGGAGLSLGVVHSADKTIRLRAGYAQGALAKMPIEAFGVLGASGLVFLDTQVDDVVYNALAIDGGSCAEFLPDFPNLQIDLSDSDGTTSVQRLYAWAAWSQTSALGIALMFKAVAALDSANFVIDAGVVDVKLDNVGALPVLVVGGYLSRSDGATVIASTSGSIQMDPGKAYVSNPAALASTTAQAVRTELAPELARIDKPVSSRATVADIFAAS